jgi:hypothetical protein
MDQPPEERPKRSKKPINIVTTVVLLCILVVAAIYFLHFRHKASKPSTNYVQQKINFKVDYNNCKSHLSELAKTNTSKLDALSAAQIYSQLGNCYLMLGQNQNALESYQSMLKYCNQQMRFSECANVATNDIQIAKDAIKSSETQAPR